MSNDELKRYGWTEAYIGETSDLVEDPEGTYVKYEDVQAEIERLKAAELAARDKAQSVAQYLRTSVADGAMHGAAYWSDALDIGASMLERSLRSIDGEIKNG